MTDEAQIDAAAGQRLELDRQIHDDDIRMNEQRLKLDQEDREAQRKLAEQRLKLDQEALNQKNNIDSIRTEREGKFFRANGAAIITAIVTLFVTGITGYQVYRNQTEQANRDEQEALIKVRDIASRKEELEIHRNETYLRIMDYLTAHVSDIFNNNRDVVLQYRTVLLATLPADARTQIFEQLRQSGRPNASVWTLGKTNYRWALVGHSDCSGRDIASSTGSSTPVGERCGPSVEGQVAVCWNGKEFRNGGAVWCTYKQATPQSCVGGGAIGEMYQCLFEISSEGTPADSVKPP